MVRLEGYCFTTNKVEYRIPRLWMARASHFLPMKLRRKLSSKPKLDTTIEPFFPEEPAFSAFLSFRDFSPHTDRTGGSSPEFYHKLRLSMADEKGNRFDPASGELLEGVSENSYWAAQTAAFPRRGKRLFLEVREGSRLVKQFNIRNPARGVYPDWKPRSLPIKISKGELEVRLTKFSTLNTTAYDPNEFSHTICAFEVFEHGKPTTNWWPAVAEISDATGNHWKPQWSRRFERMDGNTRFTGFLGGLWPGENAWRIRVRVKNLRSRGEPQTEEFDFTATPTQEL